MDVKITCIDDTMRPNEITTSNWVKKDQQYTPLSLHRNPIQGTQCWKLMEVQTNNPLYAGYNVKRFALPLDNIEEFCKKFNIVVVIELTEEQLKELEEVVKKVDEEVKEEELELV